MSPSSPRPQITGLSPLRAVEGGRVRIEGRGLTVGGLVPEVYVGERPARVLLASSAEVIIEVPAESPGGRMPVRVDGVPGTTLFLEVGRLLATGLHLVDSPAIDRQGNVYATCSGSRGQQSAVSVYRITPDGVREHFVTGIVNATSLAFDAKGRLHISSRFDGTVSRIGPDGTSEVIASELGVACGIAFDPDGVLFVGDRSGTIFRIGRAGGAIAFASLRPSIAAYHLALGPDGALYATAPTFSTRDAVYRIDRQGLVDVLYEGFGRPQGMAIDPQGHVYVAEALAGSSGIYRLRSGAPPELVATGPALIGLAFHPHGGFIAATADTVYRFQ
jgi:sugar lactone lactonase YvrE